MGRHNRNKRSKYVGQHRTTYVAQQDLGKKTTGVLALSAILTLTPAMLGYEIVENSTESMGIAPNLLEDIWREVVTDTPEETPVELDAP